MSAPGYAMRTHRILGGVAILHATVIGGTVLVTALQGWFPGSRTWVAFVTLWLIWPIILLMHRGRSVLRIVMPLLISAPLLWPAWRDYTFSAPMAVGFPPGVSLFPRDIADYLVAHRAGHRQAEKDLRSGVLAVETYGFPLPAEYTEILRDRYKVELRRIAGDIDVTVKVIGHAEGYNELSEAEIGRRFGDGVLKAAAAESLKHWSEKSPQ